MPSSFKPPPRSFPPSPSFGVDGEGGEDDGVGSEAPASKKDASREMRGVCVPSVSSVRVTAWLWRRRTCGCHEHRTKKEQGNMKIEEQVKYQVSKIQSYSME